MKQFVSCYGDVSADDPFQPEFCGNVWGPVCTEEALTTNFDTPENLECTNTFVTGPNACDGKNPELLSGGWNTLQIEILPGREKYGSLASTALTCSESGNDDTDENKKNGASKRIFFQTASILFFF